jgi:hypothetical protein
MRAYVFVIVTASLFVLPTSAFSQEYRSQELEACEWRLASEF